MLLEEAIEDGSKISHGGVQRKVRCHAMTYLSSEC